MRPEVGTGALLLSSIAYLASTIRQLGSLGTIDAETSLGTARGLQRVSRDGKPYYEFRGIPYAQQPIGNLRFEPPVRLDSWGVEVLDATNYKAYCMQYEFLTGVLLGDEACLYLNVATPKIVRESEINSTELLPVIVFFHGGGFMSGFSNVYSGLYFMDEDVVLVTINYRLGVFGFLNTGDDVVRGNMGLKDQTMALRWVQENIGNFGGDPKMVTIMGQSAGGSSVHLHMFSPLSEGLFHRAISQSGNAFNFFSLVENPREQALRLGRQMNCPTDDTRAMVGCLKAIPGLTINRANKEYRNFVEGRRGFYGPTVEFVNDSLTFLPDTPKELVMAGKMTKVPWIVGVNANEGLLFGILTLQSRRQVGLLNNEWDEYAPTMFNLNGFPKATELSQAIRKHYLGTKEIGWESLDEVSMMITDRHFFEGIYDAVRLQPALSPVYAYQFTYKGEFGLANLLIRMTSFLPRTIGLFYSLTTHWLSENLNLDRIHFGGCHLDEIPLFFHLPVISHQILPGTRDYPMSAELLKAWTTFARTGAPGSIFGREWKPVPLNFSQNPSTPVYMKLDENSQMTEETFRSRIDFWKSVSN